MHSLADDIFAACQNAAKRMSPDFAHPGDRRKIGDILKGKIRSAHRYYVDDDVTRSATKLGVQHPDVLMQMLRRARTPFDTIWLEWNLRPQLEESRPNLDQDIIERTGCLIERLDVDEPVFRMTMIVPSDTGSPEIMVVPLSILYNLNTPFTKEAKQHDMQFCSDASNLPIDYLNKTLLGSVYLNHSGDDDEARLHRLDICDRLVQHASYVPTPMTKHIFVGNDKYYQIQDHFQDIYRLVAMEFAGTWRFAISVLALMNNLDYVDIDHPRRMGTSRFVSGKIVPYMEHHLVRMRLPRKVVERRMIREMASAIPRRAHEVSGHWRSSHKVGDPACEHAYVEETKSRERCALCGHLHWWVNEFNRGDASVGFVTKDHLLTR